MDRAICWIRDPDGIVQHNLQIAGIQDIIIAPGRPTEASDLHIVTYLANTLGIRLTEQERSQPFSSGPLHDAPGVALHPGSGGAFKCWPIAHFAEVITTLWQQGTPVLLLAGPADTERLYKLTQLIGTAPSPKLLKILVNAPLIEVTTQLQHYSVYLGNDSGITHLAAMLGLPTVVLFGPSSPTLWKPIGPHVQVLFEPELENIQVKQVIDMLKAVIDAKS